MSDTTFEIEVDDSEIFLGNGRVDLSADKWCHTVCELLRAKKKIKRLRGERDRALELLAEFTDWSPGQGVLPQRSPGHGPCCTCQACGHHHDECVCEHNAIQLGLEDG